MTCNYIAKQILFLLSAILLINILFILLFKRGLNILKYATTLLSLFLSLITLATPLLVVNKVLEDNLPILAGGLFILGVILINIYAGIRGDRIANIFALCVSIFSFVLLSYPLWKPFVISFL